MPALNPLFEREWRERFRPFASHLRLGGLVVAFTLLVCLGVWRAGFDPDVPAIEWRQNGRSLLGGYRWAGAILLWGGALLLGATSVSDEKSGATWEHLLLCPFGGRGLAAGKIASSAAWLLVLQLALFPVVLVAASCFGVSPLEVASVMIAHLMLTVQGATLGFWGALRGQNLADGVAHSLGAIGRILMQTVLLAFFASCFLVLGGFVFRVLTLIAPAFLKTFVGVLEHGASEAFLWIAQLAISLVAGVTGAGVLLSSLSTARYDLSSASVFAGQLLGVALFLKWSVWEIDHPTRDFWGATAANRRPNEHLHVLYRVWSWTLSPSQLAAFPLRERRESLSKSRDLLPTWEQTFVPAPPVNAEKEAPKSARPKNPGRMRAPVSRRWQELNPVLWLDLTRCLSLRSPDSNMVPVLLSLGALGGSMMLAVSLFLIVGWVQVAFGGTRGDVSSLASTWDNLHWILRWAALVCGPLYGATGYVIERRTGMLVELRLTLIDAKAMWLGKFLARFGIFAFLSLPVLALVAFFAWNWPEKLMIYEVASALVSSWSLAAWSLLACLWLSDSSRKDLAAALWCAAFAVSWGVLLWNFPLLPWTPVHILGAILSGTHLFWRLKRLGFG